MQGTRKRTIAVFVAIPSLAFGGAGLADAAKGGSGSQSGSAGAKRSAPPGGARPSPLTGDVAVKAKSAALAAVPGSVLLAEKAHSGEATGAAYFVKVKATKGGTVEVIESSSFTVLAQHRFSRGNCPNMGGGGGPPPPGARQNGTQQGPQSQGSGYGASS